MKSRMKASGYRTIHQALEQWFTFTTDIDILLLLSQCSCSSSSPQGKVIEQVHLQKFFR